MNRRFLFSILILIVASTTSLAATTDVTHEIPEITISMSGYEKVSDVAQYGGADWSHVIGIARNISLGEAKEIADGNPEITYFFHMKGWRMVLVKEDGNYLTFHHGDAVFFSGEPWFGSAVGFADSYIKQQ